MAWRVKEREGCECGGEGEPQAEEGVAEDGSSCCLQALLLPSFRLVSPKEGCFHTKDRLNLWIFWAGIFSIKIQLGEVKAWGMEAEANGHHGPDFCWEAKGYSKV